MAMPEDYWRAMRMHTSMKLESFGLGPNFQAFGYAFGQLLVNLVRGNGSQLTLNWLLSGWKVQEPVRERGGSIDLCLKREIITFYQIKPVLERHNHNQALSFNLQISPFVRDHKHFNRGCKSRQHSKILVLSRFEETYVCKSKPPVIVNKSNHFAASERVSQCKQCWTFSSGIRVLEMFSIYEPISYRAGFLGISHF